MAASDIRLIVSDVDGVWTDGRIIYAGDRTEIKEFNVRDGLGGEARAARRASWSRCSPAAARTRWRSGRASSASPSCIRARRTSSRSWSGSRRSWASRSTQILYAGDDLPDLGADDARRHLRRAVRCGAGSARGGDVEARGRGRPRRVPRDRRAPAARARRMGHISSGSSPLASPKLRAFRVARPLSRAARRHARSAAGSRCALGRVLGRALGRLAWHVVAPRAQARRCATSPSPFRSGPKRSAATRSGRCSATSACRCSRSPGCRTWTWPRATARRRSKAASRMLELIDAGRGVVIFTAHCGNWEWLAVAIGTLRPPDERAAARARRAGDEPLHHRVPRARRRAVDRSRLAVVGARDDPGHPPAAASWRFSSIRTCAPRA